MTKPRTHHTQEEEKQANDIDKTMKKEAKTIDTMGPRSKGDAFKHNGSPLEGGPFKQDCPRFKGGCF